MGKQQKRRFRQKPANPTGLSSVKESEGAPEKEAESAVAATVTKLMQSVI